jgi:regulator of protease activity HflC (stomatin/prohibitin superfamily)
MLTLTRSLIGTMPRQTKLLLRSFYQRHRLAINLSGLLLLFLIVAMWQFITVVIPAGHIGVKWYRFFGGTDTETVYTEGTHFLWPWDKIEVYDARLQQINRDFEVLSRDGLSITVNIAFRFQINPARVGELHKYVGRDYVDVLLVPEVGAFARAVFSQNSTEDIYTVRRAALDGEIRKAVIAGLDKGIGSLGISHQPWIILADVLIRDMRFPPEVQEAINRKMAQDQLRQEYAYRLQREELESQRKEVEAHGIAQFQAIVGAGMENYLRWRGIDATLALARSCNAKVVMIGSAKGGTPLILGGAEGRASGVPDKHGEPTSNPAEEPGRTGSTDAGAPR